MQIDCADERAGIWNAARIYGLGQIVGRNSGLHISFGQSWPLLLLQLFVDQLTYLMYSFSTVDGLCWCNAWRHSDEQAQPNLGSLNACEQGQPDSDNPGMSSQAHGQNAAQEGVKRSTAKSAPQCDLGDTQGANVGGLMNDKGISAYDLPDDRDPVVQTTPCKAKPIATMMNSPGFDYSPVESSGMVTSNSKDH